MSTELTPMQKGINQAIVDSKNLAVNSVEALSKASVFLKYCNEQMKVVKATFDPMAKKAKETHQTILDNKNSYLKPLEAAKTIVNSKIVSYQILMEQARAKVAAQKAEEARIKAEAEKEAEAKQVEAEGFSEIAETIRNEERPLVVEKAVIPPEEKIAGLSFRNNWKFEVVDVKALMEAKPEYFIPNEKAIRAAVNSLKASFKAPGIKTWCEKTSIQRSK